jgi:hypothetical protein
MHHPIFSTQMEDALAAALCLWRSTHLLAVEKGPFDSIARLRLYAGNGVLGQALDCFYCLSLWLAIPLAILAGDGWVQRLLLWPALSGAACLLERATTRPSFPGMIFEETQETKE